MAKLTLKYPAVLQLIGAHAMTQETESRQFLAWFLANYYRLDETEVDDYICDGHDDKSIDALYVNEPSSEIHVFQSRLVKSDKGLGNTGLQEFYGCRTQLATRQAVEHIQQTTKNADLARLLRDLAIAEKIEKGYQLRMVFVTNAQRDHNADSYLKNVPDLILYDQITLQKEFVPTDKTEPIADEISFDVSGVNTMEYAMGSSVNMVLAPIAAADLLKMSGISNGELFAYNVRQLLPKSKVNEDIERSIEAPGEHLLFPAFHNGITVLCEKLKAGKAKITISGYSVVNGCQSLNTLNKNQKKITPDLRILVKFIQTPPTGQLAARITDHTNNQNGINPRDLQSNNLIQTRLQSEINGRGEFKYRIKRGEGPDWPTEVVIENELAARILLAFDLGEPWSCHQPHRLFDDLHSRIFARAEVNGNRIVTLYKVYQAMYAKLPLIENQLFAKYSLTRYFLLYALRKALETDPLGKEFCGEPAKFVATKRDQAKLLDAIGTISQVLVRIISREVKRLDDEKTPLDYKRELKSPTAVRKWETFALTHYQSIADYADTALTFSKLWNVKAAKKGA